MRVATYARYSTDLQNERSAEDQLMMLREKAARNGWQVVQEYADRGISGSAIATRPSVQQMLRDAANGRFDVVMAEALDRLSRSQSDIARVFEMLSFYGVRIETLSSGPVSELHVGLEGTMNRLFLVELGKKTRRGLVGRVKAGFSGGGHCYGYDIPAKGELAINESQAEVIRRIFRDYASGASPKSIAQALNAEGVAGLRGGTWSASSIYGDRRAQDGILCQELYIGTRVFNRRKFRKHPETGKRSSVLNPESEWLREPVPHLRIIEDDLWNAVRARQKSVSAQPAAMARKPKRLLSGLMRCSLCNHMMTLNGGAYCCSGHRERGVCTNTKRINALTVERRVLDGLKSKLLAPEAIAEFVAAQIEAAERERKAILADRLPLEREAAEIERKMARVKDMCLNGVIDMDEAAQTVAGLKTRKADIDAKLANAQTPQSLAIHPAAAEAYGELAKRLERALAPDAPEGIRQELRTLIEGVTFTPLEGLGKFGLEVHGQLARLLSISGDAQNAKNPRAKDSGVLLGAGVGFEPTTFRL